MTDIIEQIIAEADAADSKAAELALRAVNLRLGAIARAVYQEYPEAVTINVLRFDGDLSDDIPATVQVVAEPNMIRTADGSPIEDAYAPEWAIDMSFAPEDVWSESGSYWIDVDQALGYVESR